MDQASNPGQAPFVLENLGFQYPEGESPVFEGLRLRTAPGVTTLAGQNGTGKTTLLLLGAGRLLPTRGQVFLYGRPTDELTTEEERNRWASVLYQNMEFETEEPAGRLLEYVRDEGFHGERGTDPRGDLLDELIQVLDLDKVLSRPLQNTSKGEMQRILIAFSLLYGSRSVMMDEPVFAMEGRHKEAALDFITAYAARTGTAVFHSVHELDLARRYADNALLFSKDRTVQAGPAAEILTDKRIEEAYQLPMPMLHQKESLYRDRLVKTDPHAKQT